MRPGTRVFLGTLFLLAVAGVTAAFLYIQLGPSCREQLPKTQKSFSCRCSGFEYTRINRVSAGHVSTVCFGHVSDRTTDFASWAEWDLARSAQVKVEVGIQTLLDSTQASVIRQYAAVFERFKQGWRKVSSSMEAPQERITFSIYTPDPAGKSPIKHAVWFGIGHDFLEVQGGLRRTLAPQEKALIQSLMASR